jgi:hypothetical protein
MTDVGEATAKRALIRQTLNVPLGSPNPGSPWPVSITATADPAAESGVRLPDPERFRGCLTWDDSDDGI